MSWMQSIFGKSAPPQPSVEAQVRDTVDKNEETRVQLQERYDEQEEMIRQLGENVKRLAAAGHKAQAERTFKEMKRKEAAQRLLAGKIESISVVNEGVHDMHANVEVHSAINRANAASERIATTLSVEDVQASMSKAREHMDDHTDVSRELAGETLLDPVDEDEMQSEMSAFLGTSTPASAKQMAQSDDMFRVIDSMPAAPVAPVLTREQRAAQVAAEKRKMK